MHDWKHALWQIMVKSGLLFLVIEQKTVMVFRSKGNIISFVGSSSARKYHRTRRMRGAVMRYIAVRF